MYNEVKYWNERQNPNSSDIDKITPQHLEFVKSQVEGKKVLEVGPGIGRILPAYSNYDKICTFDISNKYHGRLMKRAKDLKLEIDFTIDDNLAVQNHILPYDDNQFDTVVCISVLLHQRPQHILTLMRELARVGKKVVVISWYEEGHVFDGLGNINGPYEGDRYCFHYDYKKIISNFGFKLGQYEAKPKLRQVFLTYSK